MKAQLGEGQLLKRGLERWRLLNLLAIEVQMLELTEDFRAAQDGLGIAHRNPGEVAPDNIEYLWEKLNDSATKLGRLEKGHQDLLEMDLPRLLVTFQRSRKKKTWPWEPEQWDLSIF